MNSKLTKKRKNKIKKAKKHLIKKIKAYRCIVDSSTTKDYYGINAYGLNLI